jgi:hypothetical protein
MRQIREKHLSSLFVLLPAFARLRSIDTFESSGFSDSPIPLFVNWKNGSGNAGRLTRHSNGDAEFQIDDQSPMLIDFAAFDNF